MRDAGYSYKIKYTLNGTDYPVTASSYNNNLCLLYTSKR